MKQLGHPAVVEAIRTAIEQDGRRAITFRDYMNICLYHEPHGYYSNSKTKIGKAGDFYTSSSIGTIMGEMVAAYIMKRSRELFAEHQPVTIVEWGGGSGRMALHVLDEIKRMAPELYAGLTYVLIESSGFHRELQQRALEAHQPVIRFLSEAQWLAEPAQSGVFALANELLDAFPVDRVQFAKGRFLQSDVIWNDDEQAFQEIWREIDSKRLLDCLQEIKVQWLEGQIIEVNVQAIDWLSAAARRIGRGECIIIDYGDLAEELYAPHRMLGTLLCYKDHQATDDFLYGQGEQDMTAHVNFSALLQAAEACGFSESRLRTQREFLVEQGILQRLQDHHDPNPFSEVSRRNRSIRQLLLSDQMSELFKVMTANKKGDPNE